MIDALETQDKGDRLMREISTVAMGRIEKFKDGKPTIGLDLGDRLSHSCILNEAGEVMGEHNLPTAPEAIDKVLSQGPAQSDRAGNGNPFAG
jgi:hypothetical protein